MPLPLSDIRVLSVEQFGAGPWGTMQLADLGADVIKVEDPQAGGDVARYVPPYQEGEHSLFFESFNRNKRSIVLDLRAEAGREVFRELVRSVDAVYCNLRGDGPARLGITYADLKAVNPRVVCCSLSGFGADGPRAQQAGYDYMMQGLAGWMSLTGEPDGPPSKSGLSLVDLVAGYVSVLTMVAAIWRARRDGVGGDCDVSLFETALAQLAYVGTWTATEGFRPPRVSESGHLSIVPFQAFACRDDWIVVACPKQRFWERLCHALDRHDLLEDGRYRDFAGRLAHREPLLDDLRGVFRGRTAEDWVRRLEAAGVPVARVSDVGEALDDPQLAARGGLVSYEHPVLGTVRQVASPLRVSGAPHPVRRAPLLGEHTRTVIGELCGYGDAQLSALEARGAFGA